LNTSLNKFNFREQKAMGDNVNAKKKLEQIEKARQVEKDRKERISERKKTKGIDISEGEKIKHEVDISHICVNNVLKFAQLALQARKMMISISWIIFLTNCELVTWILVIDAEETVPINDETETNCLALNL